MASSTISLCIVWSAPFCFKPLLISSFCCILKNKAASTAITTRLGKSFVSWSLKPGSLAAPGNEQHADQKHNRYFYLAAFWDSAQVLFVRYRSRHVEVEQITPTQKVHTLWVSSLHETRPSHWVLYCLKLMSSLHEAIIHTGDNCYGSTPRSHHCVPGRKDARMSLLSSGHHLGQGKNLPETSPDKLNY